jgi:two-component system chemotaxis response regulator CheB
MHVLIVNDSSIQRLRLRKLLETANIRVSEATSGPDAVLRLESIVPDLVVVDAHVASVAVFEATRIIVQRWRPPVVLLTSQNQSNAAEVRLLALEADAELVECRPYAADRTEGGLDSAALVTNLRRLSVHTLPSLEKPVVLDTNVDAPQDLHLSAWHTRGFKGIGIGASAGGPPAIKRILQSLNIGCPWPIFLVQHISPGFAQSYCQWLSSQTHMPVVLAVDGEPALPGQIHVAPDEQHLRVDANVRMHLSRAANRTVICPAIDVLFESLGQSMGAQVIALMLSGMGRDGADSLTKLRMLGALTLVQDPATALVGGMPLAAIEKGAACFVQAPEAIAATINRLMQLRLDGR